MTDNTQPSTLGRILGLVIPPALLTTIVICGGVMFKQHKLQADHEARKEAEFQRWVAWRGEHCRFEGTLGEGLFVCDNGKSYQARSGRYGEVKRYPLMINGVPADKTASR